MKIVEELRQRKVLQTAAVYFAVAWGVTEVLSYLIERIPVFPAWADTAIAILFVLGFPVTVFLSWMFDVGEGNVRRADPASGLGKGVIVLSVAGLLAVTAGLSYLIWPQVQTERGFVHEGDFGTVAVLPFENLTGDPSLGYLGAGLAEDIRQRLLKETDLEVIGRVSMAGFSGAGVDLASIRGILNAGHVLEGNLQQYAGQLQVGVALLDTTTGKQVWGNTFSADRADFDPLRQRIVTSLAEQLALTVRVHQAEAPVPGDALKAYLHGLADLNQPDVADGWFDEAIRLHPDFADAWARKALLRVDMNLNGMPREQSWEEAEPLFTRAHAIEPGNLLASVAQARLMLLVNFDVVSATDVARQAEDTAPNHPLVIGLLAELLAYQTEKGTEALTYCRRFLALDPLNPDAYTFMANALGFQDRLIEAWPLFDRALELDPGRRLTYEYKANWEFFRGRPAQAAATFTRWGRAEGGASESTQRCLVYIAGELLPIDRAEPMLKEAIRRQVGTSGGHEWCVGVLETLISRLIMAKRLDDLRALLSEYQDQDIWTFGNESKLMPMLALADGDGNAEFKVLEELLGADSVAAFRGPDPPLAIFKFWIALDIARALIHKGQVEEGRQVAGKAADAILAGASAQNGETAIDVLAAAGRVEEALDRAERVGVDGFAVMGRSFLEPGGVIPELADEPRWQAFLEQCRSRWLEEVDKFDRMVAFGEIEMPVQVPGPAADNLPK